MRLYPVFQGGSETLKVAQLMSSPYLQLPSCSAHCSFPCIAQPYR